MKNSNSKIKRVSRVLSKVIIIAYFFVFLFSCSDDISIKNDSTLGNSGVTLYIPDIESAVKFASTRSDGLASTRGQMSVTQSEATINKIYLIAVNSNEEALVFNLNANAAANTSGYHQCGSVKLNPGSYRFYVVANLDDYLKDNRKLEEFNNLEDIQELVLNFAQSSNGLKLQAGNLPMACLPSEIKTEENGPGVGDNYIEIKDNTNSSIFADLTFLCSKIRYTILFDKEDYSSNFTSTEVDFEKEVSANNVAAETPFISINTSNTDISQKIDNVKVSLQQVYYPNSSLETEKEYLSENVERSNQNDLEPLKDEGKWENENQRAWQMIAYLPENIQDEEADKTNLTFKSNSEILQNEYNVVLIDKNLSSTNKGIKRGCCYDIVSKLTSTTSNNFTTTISVAPWTVETLTYSLTGPFELEVENTELKLESGKWVTLGFNSDTKVSWTEGMPIFKDSKGREYRFYEIEPISSNTEDENGNSYDFNDGFLNHIRIRINPKIPYSELKNLSSFDDYCYFHLKAGNLLKKITIEQVQITPTLAVSPVKIVLNVRELTASFSDNGTFDIQFSTNMEVSGTSKNLLIEGNGLNLLGSTNVLNLNDKDNNISNNYLVNPSGVLTLNYKDILNGNSFWKRENEFKLKFTLKISDSEAIEKEVSIKVVPYTTDYVIHFKCKQGIWTNPHIYVYQCLEMPMDYDFLIPNADDNNKKIPAAGLTVGYKTPGSSTNDNNAGLEYLFSNNISFKGWLGYGGNIGYKHEESVNGTVYKEGFVHITGYDSYGSKFFNPTANHPTHYDYDTDLNTEHYREINLSDENKNWNCPECQDKSNLNSGGTRGWPGVAMIYEGNGWWRYTLSGIATPGKALIMFTNNHGNVSSNSLRYPKNNAVGIPLFDFPNNEGWILYDASLDRNGNHANDNQNFSNNYNLSSGYNEDWTPSKAVDLYLKGDMTFIDGNRQTWLALPSYQFYKVSENEWRTGLIAIEENQTFKIQSKNNDISISGNGNQRWIFPSEDGFSDLEKEKNYNSLIYKGGEKGYSSNFVGYAVLTTKDNQSYTLKLVEVK